MASSALIETEENSCVDQLKHWLETKAKFYGRTDEDFLLTFVRGCKLDMEKAQKKLYMYYENRRKIPHWWANRDISQLEEFLQLRVSTVLSDKDPGLPATIFHKLSRASSVQFDRLMTMLTICLDILLRRNNCQKNGLIVLIDCADYPLWIFQKALSPITMYNVVHGFITASPIRVKACHVFNFPMIGRAGWRIIKPLLPSKIQKRCFLYGSDLAALQSNVDVNLLPEEYGGENGCLVDHEEAYLNEVYSYSDYFLDDNKYGFQ